MHGERRKRTRTLALVGMLTASWLPSARAADTVETWALGATDVDYYVGVEGMGAGDGEATVFGDIMLGYGLADRFSAFLGSTVQSREHLADAEPSLYLGVFGTPVETDHVDLDLFLTHEAGGPSFSLLQISPAIELNLDSQPDMTGWGLFLRAAMQWHHHPASGEASSASEGKAAWQVAMTPGAYLMVAEGHQLVIEYDMAYHPRPLQEERRWEVGGVAVGYNVALNDTLEILTELSGDIPQGDERATWGITTGLIATLPSAAPGK